jgi:hypothetical protein
LADVNELDVLHIPPAWPLAAAAVDRLPCGELGVPDLDDDPCWRLVAAFLVECRHAQTRRAYSTEFDRTVSLVIPQYCRGPSLRLPTSRSDLRAFKNTQRIQAMLRFMTQRAKATMLTIGIVAMVAADAGVQSRAVDTLSVLAAIVFAALLVREAVIVLVRHLRRATATAAAILRSGGFVLLWRNVGDAGTETDVRRPDSIREVLRTGGFSLFRRVDDGLDA